MDREQIQKLVRETEKKFGAEFEEVNHYIYLHPELGLKEYVSSEYLVEVMRKKGFAVEKPYAGFETLSGSTEQGPEFAFLAEYDALPAEEKRNSRACGPADRRHGPWGAVVLAELCQKDRLPGRNCQHAGGAYGAKVESGQRFDDVDVALSPSFPSPPQSVAWPWTPGCLITEKGLPFSRGPERHQRLDSVQLLYATSTPLAGTPPMCASTASSQRRPGGQHRWTRPAVCSTSVRVPKLSEYRT